MFIILNRYSFAPRRSERRQTSRLEFLLLGFGEKLNVLRVRAWPTALDVMNPKGIEFLGDAELVDHREVDALTLAAIAQGRVVKFHFGFHNVSRRSGKKHLC